MPLIEVSEQTYQRLQQIAQATRQPIAEVIAFLLVSLPQEYTPEEVQAADDELFLHVVHAPYAVGSDNESIDADLITAYTDDHNPISPVEGKRIHSA